MPNFSKPNQNKCSVHAFLPAFLLDPFKNQFNIEKFLKLIKKKIINLI